MTYLSPVHRLDLFLMALLTAHSPLANIQGFHFYGVSAPFSHTLPPPSHGGVIVPFPRLALHSQFFQQAQALPSG